MGNVFWTWEGDDIVDVGTAHGQRVLDMRGWSPVIVLSTLGSDSTSKNSFSSFLSHACTHARTHTRTHKMIFLCIAAEVEGHGHWSRIPLWREPQAGVHPTEPWWCHWGACHSSWHRASTWSVLTYQDPEQKSLQCVLFLHHLPSALSLCVVPIICYCVHRCCEVCYASCRRWATEHW